MSEVTTSTTKEPGLENSASDIVEKNLTDYSAEVIKMQFPSAIDGLKKVQLRFLWAGRKGEFNEETKSQIVIGAIGKLHNYGDVSAYDAVVRMAQSWNVFPPTVRLFGNYGSYSGGNPASARYTSMELTAFARDVFYGGIDLNVLPMLLTPDGEFEPLYFIPMIPTAMLYDSLAIGFGYQSKTVALNMANICDLVYNYGLHQTRTPYKSFDFVKHVEKFLPDFPNPCVLTNADELIASYKQGMFDKKILLEGHVVLAHDTIIVNSLPDITIFTNAKSIIETAIRDKTSPYESWINGIFNNAEIVDLGNLIIELKRGVNVFDVWDELRKLLKFSGTMTPNPNYSTADGKIIRMSPLSLLYVWFEKRRNVIMSSKRRKLERLQRDLRIIDAQLIVYDFVDEVIEISRSQNTRSDTVQKLCARFNISEFQALALTRLEIGDLSKTSRHDLQTKRHKQADDIATLTESFSKIGEEIANDALRIKKTYSAPRHTVIQKFIGVVYTAGGSIQIESTDEINGITERFPKGDITVMMYDGGNLLHILPDGKPTRGVVSKYTRGEIYGLPFSGNSGYTVSIKDGAICSVVGVVPGRRSDGYYYTNKTAKALTRKGEILTIDVTKDLPLRKSIGRGNKTDIIYLYPNIKEIHYLVILNDKEPNIVHLQQVQGEAAKITISPIGSLIISHSFTGKNWYLSIPEQYLNRISARVFQIVDAAALLDGARQLRLNLANSTIKRNPNFIMIA